MRHLLAVLTKHVKTAMAQIKNRRYDEALRENGRCEILAYGIAFHKKPVQGGMREAMKQGGIKQ